MAAEHDIETHLLTAARRAGFLLLKFTCPGRDGVPDRVLITPAGTLFVELKAPGCRPRRLQEVTFARMARSGARIHVIDSIAAADRLIDELVSAPPR